MQPALKDGGLELFVSVAEDVVAVRDLFFAAAGNRFSSRPGSNRVHRCLCSIDMNLRSFVVASFFRRAAEMTLQYQL